MKKLENNEIKSLSGGAELFRVDKNTYKISGVNNNGLFVTIYLDKRKKSQSDYEKIYDNFGEILGKSKEEIRINLEETMKKDVDQYRI